MSRSVWKGPFVEQYVLKKLFNGLTKGKKNKKVPSVWSRRSTIIPQFVGRSIKVHNGRTFIQLNVTENMIGHKLGEFVLTRSKPVHKIKTKK